MSGESEADREHDETYKRVFAHPALMRQLVESFASAELASQLDFDVMEQLSGAFVSPGLTIREADLVWKIARRGDEPPLYICVLLEFQSSVDVTMAHRVHLYVALLHDSLLKQLKPIPRNGWGVLPHVLPIVLYNGERPWNTPRNILNMIAGAENNPLPQTLAALEFILIDEGRLEPAALDEANNIVAQMFKLEQLRRADELPQEVRRFLALMATLTAPIQLDLQRWLTHLLKQSTPQTRLRVTQQLQHFQEIHPMHFANTFVRFLEEQDDLLQQRLEQGFEQGIEQGFEQGIEQGKLRERRAMLAKLLHLRFGEREGREAWLAALSLDALDHAVELVLSAEDEQQLIRTLDPST